MDQEELQNYCDDHGDDDGNDDYDEGDTRKMTAALRNAKQK